MHGEIAHADDVFQKGKELWLDEGAEVLVMDERRHLRSLGKAQRLVMLVHPDDGRLEGLARIDRRRLRRKRHRPLRLDRDISERAKRGLLAQKIEIRSHRNAPPVSSEKLLHHLPAQRLECCHLPPRRRFRRIDLMDEGGEFLLERKRGNNHL